MATNASCRAARSRACAWTLPVATVGTPSRRASAASPRLSARSWRGGGWGTARGGVRGAVVAGEGALQLAAELVRAEGAQQPAHRRLVAHALTCAAAQAQEPLRPLE